MCSRKHAVRIVLSDAQGSRFVPHGSELRSIDSRDIPSSLSEGIHAYNDLWLTSGASPMEQHLFRWNSSRAFPSLSYGAQTGTITHTTNPLIIVVNDISTSLNLEGFLIPAMSTANLVFANADVLHQAFGRHGVNSLDARCILFGESVSCGCAHICRHNSGKRLPCLKISYCEIILGNGSHPDCKRNHS